MALKEVICDNCGYKEEILHREGDYPNCPKCNHLMRHNYASLKGSFTCFRGSKYNTAGNLQNFSIKNDPNCAYELGLLDDKGKYAKLPDSERVELRKKFDREGDSVALRNEIIKKREAVGAP